MEIKVFLICSTRPFGFFVHAVVFETTFSFVGKSVGALFGYIQILNEWFDVQFTKNISLAWGHLKTGVENRLETKDSILFGYLYISHAY